VLTGLARPFREPGVEVPDPLPAGAPRCVPRFDANPERIRVDSDAQVGAPKIDVTTGALVTGLAGPLDNGFRTYTVVPDPGATVEVTGNVTWTDVAAPGPDEVSVATFNAQRFFDTADNPATSDVALTAAAFDTRLRKLSTIHRTVLQQPDIVGLQEVENLATLEAIAARINDDAVMAGGEDPGYQAYLAEGNDIGGLDVGFLVKEGGGRVTVLDVTQENKDETYVNPLTGLPELLNDRPPLVLRAVVQHPAGPAFPVTVIANHLRSLGGVDDPVEGARVRAKRQAQAESLARLVQARQAADPGERIAVLGDFNAFQFNDGYVDTIGTVRGTPTPPDHVVLASADFPEASRGGPDRPERLSDHPANNTSTVTTMASNPAPVISPVTATPWLLWPPNHRMRSVTLDYTATDTCGPVTCGLAVTSDEPLNGTGDGDTTPDWEVLDATRVRLRAERAGMLDGRLYTVTVTCRDSAGNEATAPAEVTVPLSRR
jgi:hypothetical protein